SNQICAGLLGRGSLTTTRVAQSRLFRDKQSLLNYTIVWWTLSSYSEKHTPVVVASSFQQEDAF
ncbi:hypothetical protein Csa_005896, partial [Cucumis sativus]